MENLSSRIAPETALLPNSASIRHPHVVINFGPPDDADALQELNDAARHARLAGWRVLGTSLDQVVAFIKDGRAPFEIVRARSTDSAISVLTPTEKSEAAPQSLSGTYGTGAFPLHTDGAHLDFPPEFTILESEGSGNGDAATTLHRFEIPALRSRLIPFLRLGIFRVEAGAGRGFYAPIIDPDTDALRFDPNCMTPVDWRADEVAAHMRNLSISQQQNWGSEKKTLIICNHVALHGREAIGDQNTTRTLRRIMIRRKG